MAERHFKILILISPPPPLSILIFLGSHLIISSYRQFMVITYTLQVAWLLMFCFLVIVTFVFTIFWNMCANPRVGNLQDCIDFTQFCTFCSHIHRSKCLQLLFFLVLDFLFPHGTRQEHMKVCETQEVKLFCKDYVEKAEVMFILATAATVLIILSLVRI